MKMLRMVSVSHNIQVWRDLRFHYVDVQWQLEMCTLLKVPFCCPNNLQPGSPNVALTRPNLTKSIYGDGKCLFRCFSYLITGSQMHHMAVRSALVDHMVSIPAVFGGNVEDYLAHTNMNRSRTWGNTEEVLGLSYLLNTPVYSYIPSTHNWVRIFPDNLDPSLFTLITQKSIYMINERNDDNEGMHFEVVISTLF